MKGRNIFMGYLNDPVLTKEIFDDEGWMHSGDIGKKDDDGFFFVTGRIKGLFNVFLAFSLKNQNRPIVVK